MIFKIYINTTKFAVSKAVEIIKENTIRSLIIKFIYLEKYIGIEKAFGVKDILYLRWE